MVLQVAHKDQRHSGRLVEDLADSGIGILQEVKDINRLNRERSNGLQYLQLVVHRDQFLDNL